MRRKIPSTTALTAFEASARHESFTKAADELAVSQSAVCRQIAILEEFLGVKLFRRVARGVVLTEAGVSYSRQVGARLDEMERDTLDLMAKGGRGASLELSVGPTFCVRWLIPRLTDFAARHPEIALNLSARTRPYLFAETHFDAAIHAGQSPWPGTESRFLMNENLVAVCHPKLMPARQAGRDLDWSSYQLLHSATRPYAWRQWFSSRDMTVANDMSGPRYELFSMLIAAALQCQGIALVPRFLIEEELETKQLILVADHDYLSDRSYYLIYPERKAENPALAVFGDWLEETAKQYSDAIGLSGLTL